MVISHKNKYVFVRVPKNASTTLAAYLIKNHTGDEDIWTRVNDAGIKDHNVPKSTIDRYKHQYQFIHLTPNQILEEDIIDEATMRSYDLTAVLRNPLERVVSLFCFKRKGSIEDFRKMVSEHGHIPGDINNARPQTDYFKIGNEIAADIWLYDNINSKFEGLARHKTQFRKTPWQDYYDDASKEAVIEYFKEDYEMYQGMIK